MSKRSTTKRRVKPRTEELETEQLADGRSLETEHAALPQRRGLSALLTPLRVGLLCLLIAAAGFIGGVLVQKGSEGSSSSNPFGSGDPPGLDPGAAGGEGFVAAIGGGTMGTVSTVDGGALYVTDAQGNTFKVLATGATKVTRSAETGPHQIHPGDTVLIQGQKRKNGTVKAQSISATAAGASSGVPGGGAAPSSSASSTSSGDRGSAVNQLFGN